MVRPDYRYYRNPSGNVLYHAGKGHEDNPPGRGSGRYPYGSGKRPFQDKEIRRQARRETMKKIGKTAKEIGKTSLKIATATVLTTGLTAAFGTVGMVGARFLMALAPEILPIARASKQIGSGTQQVGQGLRVDFMNQDISKGIADAGTKSAYGKSMKNVQNAILNLKVGENSRQATEGAKYLGEMIEQSKLGLDTLPTGWISDILNK